MAKKIAENFNRLSRLHERYRQTTDGTAIAYSKREREFTFGKNDLCQLTYDVLFQIRQQRQPTRVASFT